MTGRLRGLGAGAASGQRSEAGGRGPEAEVPVAVVLDLLVAACAAGAPVPRALGAVGTAVGGGRGAALGAAATALLWGAPWDEAWPTGRGLDPVARALRPAWEDGSPPVGALRVAADQLRRDQRSAASSAAGRLGVRLVLPLGLCHLPAFVLVGIVPVVLALTRGTLG